MNTTLAVGFFVLAALASIVIVWLASNRHRSFGAGWLLARWASGESWRAPALWFMLGLVALAVAAWAHRLAAPFLFSGFIVVLGAFRAGLWGSDERGEGEPSDED